MNSASVYIHFPMAVDSGLAAAFTLLFPEPRCRHSDTSGVSQHVPLGLPQPPLPLKSTPSPSTTLHQLSNRAGTKNCLLPLLLFLEFPLCLPLFPVSLTSLLKSVLTFGSLSLSLSPSVTHLPHTVRRERERDQHMLTGAGGGVY